MNVPSQPQGNWQWRMAPKALSPELGRRIRELTGLYGRLPGKES